MRHLVLYLLFSLLLPLAAKVEDVSIPSKHMKATFKARVITPTTYNGKTPLKQIILLHGAGGNHSDWERQTGLLQQMADRYNRIITCPTAGIHSWYNSFNKSENYIVSEVLPFIDAKYKTLPDRWLTGLSMGGFGSINLGFKYPQHFSAYAGQSPCIKPSAWTKNWGIKQAMGKQATEGFFDQVTSKMIKSMKKQQRPFAILCGEQDFFYKECKQAVDALKTAGVRLYFSPTQGKHNWAYWKKSLPMVLAYFERTTSKTPLPLYVLSGQSNMQGLGKISDLPKELKGAQVDCIYWNNKGFEPLTPGLSRTSSRAAEFGPEMGFALQMKKLQPKTPMAFVKYHASGQPLHHGWNGNKWVGGKPSPKRWNFYPGENAKDPNVGQHYKKLRQRCLDAIAGLKAEGTAYQLKGFAWMQGEQDSKKKESAEAYAANLKRLKLRLQADLGHQGKMAMVFGQVLPHTPALERFTHRSLIRQRMAEADAKSGSPLAIDYCTMVPTEGMPLRKDTVHYDSRGQLMLGEAFAKALLAKP